VIDIKTTTALRACMKQGDFSWPGGYPIFYVTSDGAALSPAAVRSNQKQIESAIDEGASDGWRVVGCLVNYEQADLHCADTGQRIPSAYADD
jgi:hypothetical protein